MNKNKKVFIFTWQNTFLCNIIFVLRFEVQVSEWVVAMASMFTRILSGRNTAVIMASLGAGTLVSSYVMTESGVSAGEKKKLYPPRWRIQLPFNYSTPSLSFQLTREYLFVQHYNPEK